MAPTKDSITEPVDAWVERVIDRALLKHEKRCPLREPMARLQQRFAYVVGFVIGSGIIGGAVGAFAARSGVSLAHIFANLLGGG